MKSFGFGAALKVHQERLDARRALVENSLGLARRADDQGDCHEALYRATEAEHYMGMVEAEAFSIDPSMLQPGVAALGQRVAGVWRTIARKCVRGRLMRATGR